MSKKIKVGFLTYDLQPFTEDCIFRVQSRLSSLEITAYPIIFHKHQQYSRVRYFGGNQNGSFIGFSDSKNTPEGFMRNINLKVLFRCLISSEVIVLFGLQGATALILTFFAYALGKKIVTVNQTLPLMYEKKRKKWIVFLKRFILKVSTVNISQTLITSNVLQDFYGVKSNTIFYAPFESGAMQFNKLISLNRSTSNEARKFYNIPQDHLVLIYAGNLHTFKGIIVVLQALAILKNDKLLSCIFAGPEEPKSHNGGTISFYNNLASELGVLDKVIFTGKLNHDDLITAYKASDIVILPSYRDTFGKVLVEGALLKKPLIATNAVGSVNSILIDGENGFVFNPGDSKGLSEIILKFKDEKLLKSMGEKSIELATKFCNPEVEVRGFVGALKRATNQ